MSPRAAKWPYYCIWADRDSRRGGNPLMDTQATLQGDQSDGDPSRPPRPRGVAFVGPFAIPLMTPMAYLWVAGWGVYFVARRGFQVHIIFLTVGWHGLGPGIAWLSAAVCTALCSPVHEVGHAYVMRKCDIPYDDSVAPKWRAIKLVTCAAESGPRVSNIDLVAMALAGPIAGMAAGWVLTVVAGGLVLAGVISPWALAGPFAAIANNRIQLVPRKSSDGAVARKALRAAGDAGSSPLPAPAPRCISKQ